MTQQLLPMTNVNRWFPSDYNRGPNILVWIALLSCFLAAFIKIWTPTSLNRWPEAAATLLFIYPFLKNWRFFKKQWLIKLMGLAFVSPILFFAINYLIDAESAVKYVHFESLARIYLFIPIAWWLGGSLRTISIFLIVALAGFFFACLQDPHFIASIQKIVAGNRVDFGILNAQHVALFFCVSLIGLLSFIPKALAYENSFWKVLISASILLAAAICIFGLIGTQTRAAFLALAISFILFIIQQTIKLTKKSRSELNIKKLLVISIVVTITVLSLVILKPQFGQSLENRITKEGSTLTAILNKDWQNIPFTSIGIRVNTWILALDKIAEKPLIGYGANVRLDAIKNSDLPEHIKQRFGHFHNSYIEFTLGYGILGLILAVSPFIFILIYSKNADLPIKNFTVYSLVIFSIMNFFESYLFFWMGAFMVTIICAPVLSLYFAKSNQNMVTAKETPYV